MRDKVAPTKEFCKYGHRMLITGKQKKPRPNEANIRWKKRQVWRDAPARWYAECRQCCKNRDKAYDLANPGRRQKPSKSRRTW